MSDASEDRSAGVPPAAAGASRSRSPSRRYDFAVSATAKRASVSAVPALLTAAALSAPLLAAAHFTFLAMAIVLFFSPVCHQDPARSFWLAGSPLAVCARCLGIYLGAAAGAWLRAPQRVLLPLLSVAVALNLFDIFTEWIGLHGNWISTRFVFGLLAGGAAGALVANWTVRAARYSDR